MRISVKTRDLQLIACFIGKTNAQPWCGRPKRFLFVHGLHVDAISEGDDDEDSIYFATLTISERHHGPLTGSVAEIDFTEIEALEHLGTTV